jgi:hypothetical protein
MNLAIRLLKNNTAESTKAAKLIKMESNFA